jgi:hypothetical protein
MITASASANIPPRSTLVMSPAAPQLCVVFSVNR